MKIYLKIHEVSDERILAACDSELLGKKFSDGSLQLEVKEKFYNGTLTDIDTLKKELQNATIVNLVGNNVVGFAVKNNLVEKENILKIKNIKHAQIVFL